MKNKNCFVDLTIAIIPVILLAIMEIMNALMNIGNVLHMPSIIFEVIILYAFVVLFVGVTKKLSISVIITSTVLFILMLINQFKVNYTGEPLLISDFAFLRNAESFLGIIEENGIDLILKNIPHFIILLIIFVFVSVICIKNDVEVKTAKKRIFCIIIPIIIYLIIFIPNKFTKKLYLDLIYDAKNHKDYASYTTNLEYYSKYGFLSGMYGVMLNNRFEEPEDYDYTHLESILNSYNDKETVNNLGKPNIILVFSESFFDISKIEELKFNTEVTANYNRLKNQGKCMELLSPSYGGMSENVAFEILTGAKMCYFNKGYIPISQLYRLEGSLNMPSVIKELKQNGYEAYINFAFDYYNSEDSMIKIGFDLYNQEYDKNNLETITDKHMTDVIIKRFENKEKGVPMFQMVETFENHMPYSKDKYENYDIELLNDDISQNDKETLEAYAQGLYNADKQLARLHEYINGKEEPTLIIFLGDHLPYLYNDDGENILTKFKYFDTIDENMNNYNLYTTEALVLANYDIDYNIFPKVLSTDYLLTTIINNMDLTIDNYYKWLFDIKTTIPSYNHVVARSINDDYFSISNIMNEMKELYDLREKMQYHMFISNVNN